MSTEQAECLVCHRDRAVNACGRLRKHASKAGPGVCRGSGRPTNRMLDEQAGVVARLRAENSALRSELSDLRELADLVGVWADLTGGSS